MSWIVQLDQAFGQCRRGPGALPCEGKVAALAAHRGLHYSLAEKWQGIVAYGGGITVSLQTVCRS
jgi:hypothetical protein